MNKQFAKWTGLNLWECMSILNTSGHFENSKDESKKVGKSWYQVDLYLNTHLIPINSYILGNSNGVSIFQEKYFNEHKEEILINEQ